MKKTYISPEMQCIKIATASMLAASNTQGLGAAVDFSSGGDLSGAPEFEIDEVFFK